MSIEERSVNSSEQEPRGLDMHTFNCNMRYSSVIATEIECVCNYCTSINLGDIAAHRWPE